MNFDLPMLIFQEGNIIFVYIEASFIAGNHNLGKVNLLAIKIQSKNKEWIPKITIKNRIEINNVQLIIS